MARIKFEIGEYYHIYNRGVDKRNIVIDDLDSNRLLQSLNAFNSVKPVGSLFITKLPFFKEVKKKKLVEIVSYCINPNHYHLLVKEITEGGASEFMKRVNGGYTWYFNNRHKRQGALFQGRFKAKHISENPHLLHVSAYINLNDKVHSLSGPTAKFVRSSWKEYLGNSEFDLCSRGIILEQFNPQSDYKKFALGNLPYMLSKREGYKELAAILQE